MPAELLIGPVLRHVGRTDATVWVETSAPCTVEIHGSTERTWTVAGHHYALVTVIGLEPGTAVEYRVLLDGEQRWPLPDSPAPSYLRTPADAGDVRLVFGSCRFATRLATDQLSHYGVDALDGLAMRMMRQAPRGWPTAMLMLGDQVYADHFSPAVAERVAERRRAAHEADCGPSPARKRLRRSGMAPDDQVADYEEYTWLYQESWTDPDIRWLLSNLPTSMIFDDHDVHDDWNTSDSWRAMMRAKPWWPERITSGMMSYWVYQHLGNLGPEELAENALYQAIRTSGEDGEAALREFAQWADEEADGGRPVSWSYRRDLGATRLVVIDSRAGRILTGCRKMVSDTEMDWIADSCRTDQEHILLATSVPWLLAPPLSRWEAASERLAAGKHGRVGAVLGEKLRRAADLEHWAAFSDSFARLSDLVRDVAAGALAPSGEPPSTVDVLSGDVHHAYAARVHWDSGDPRAPVYQLTCSPMHNHIPAFMKVAFRAMWWRALRGKPGAGPDGVAWSLTDGPLFGNLVATLRLGERAADVVFERASRFGERIELRPVARRRLVD